MKYTREILEPLVRESVSVAEVLRKLNKKQSGSVATHVSNVIKKLGINTSHFLGAAANQGPNHRGGPNKKDWQDILILRNSDRREKSYRLRRALIESGRDYSCEICHNDGNWLGKTLLLQIEHKNGNWQDCRPENIGFYCPNCHSQTKNHSGSLGLTDCTSTARYYREKRKKDALKRD